MLLQSYVSPRFELLSCDPQEKELYDLTNANQFIDFSSDVLTLPYGVLNNAEEVGELKVKNILFTLEYMLEPIHPYVVQKYKHVDFIQCISQWAKQLLQYTQQLQQYWLNNKQNYAESLGASYFGIMMTKQQVIHLIKRSIILMENLARKDVTHLDLLKKVDPMLGNYYEAIIKRKDLSPLQRFQLVEHQQPAPIDTFLLQSQLAFQEQFQQQKHPTFFDFKKANLSDKQLIGPTQIVKLIEKYTCLLPRNNEPIKDVVAKLKFANKNQKLL